MSIADIKKWGKIWREAPRLLKKPHVRKKIDVSWQLFADRSSQKPLVGFGVAGSWHYPLVDALQIVGVVGGLSLALAKLCKR